MFRGVRRPELDTPIPFFICLLEFLSVLVLYFACAISTIALCLKQDMKIVCISDTHSMHLTVHVPDGDVLIHAGDMTGRGTEQDLIKLNNWLGTLPHRHKLLTPGNHDKICSENPELAKQLLSNAKLLIDEEITIDGVRFYFSPWTPQFFDWWFMYDRTHGERVWERIPDGIDVLVTHGPPLGILDQVLRPARGDWESESVGCIDLLHRVMNVKPKVHIFGHIHEGYGEKTEAGIRFVNASTCTDMYRPSNPPIVIEVSNDNAQIESRGVSTSEGGDQGDAA